MISTLSIVLQLLAVFPYKLRPGCFPARMEAPPPRPGSRFRRPRTGGSRSASPSSACLAVSRSHFRPDADEENGREGSGAR